MGNWQAEIDIKTAWKTEDSRVISKRIIEELTRIRPNLCESEQEELNGLVDSFKEIQDTFGASGFNSLMQELYDWADAASVWIGVIF
jgi:hypothetical protein